MAHAKSAQIKHWSVILSAQFDEAYLHSVQAIGQAHCRLGLEPKWYIGAYAMLVNGLIKAVIDAVKAQESKNWLGRRDDDTSAQLINMIRAINLVSMLDMDLSISVYIDEGRKQRTDLIERLGVSFQNVTEAIASTTHDLNSTSQILTENADKTRELSMSAASGSEECSVTVSSVANAAVELGKAINEISRQVQDSSQIALNAVSQANLTNDRMDELQVAATRIGDVVQLIASVAEQTNLLALNATIEAARAGESGRGFAIVAQEVKALAAQTEKATADIRDQIASMQRLTTESVRAIKDISATIENISHISTAIASAVEEQDAATRNIAHSIDQTAMGVGSVAKSVSEVNNRAVETGEAASRVLKAAETLKNESERLAREAQHFRTMKVA
jgi:methyl-accepting chemotaxis protein